MAKLGAGWRSTKGTGDIIANGELDVAELTKAIAESDGEKVKFVMFKNSYKKAGDNRPDFNILVSKPKEATAPKQVKTEDSFFAE